MYIILDRPIEPYCVRFWEELGLAVGANEAGEYFVSWFDFYWTTIVIDRLVYCAEPVGAKCSVQSDTLHGIMQQLLIGFRAVRLRPF